MARRNDLNGTLLQPPNCGTTYLVLGGRRHLVPDRRVLALLFRSKPPVRTDIDPDDVDEGDPLPDGGCLVRVTNSAEVYLVPGSDKLWFVGPDELAANALGCGRTGACPDIEMARCPAD
ncbi:hypothetical protein T8K17_22625 [Thalassobaculum sp. OXR-137]|uniref:hypothetical protein n=1 Tax=Thalassobaculum sp. OXR-137 TaxID=3100173 RepID=UPI002AC9A1EE|nr:hypothetical protein [Thalassobaculum sp. OXR-137]WPZ34022.1 hypothetical protein T8K17_22625 [Thalassobaculum sp. OXR-137]